MTRTIIIFITIILFSTFVYGQSSSYPGLIKVVYNKLSMRCSYTVGNKDKTLICKSDTIVLKFYKSPNEKDFDKELAFYYVPSSPIMIKHLIQRDYSSWLNPALLKCDTTRGDYIIHFICKTQKDNWYEVVTNEESGETKWINDKRFFKLFTWNKLAKTDYITICVQPKNNIYSKSDSNTTIIKHSETDFFEIIKTKGNWMKIKAQTGDHCGNSTENVYFAWFNFKSVDNLFFNFHIYGFIF